MKPDGTIIIGPELKITHLATPPAGAAKGALNWNQYPRIAVDSVGNLRLFWWGYSAGTPVIQGFWHALLDKNGAVVSGSPAVKIANEPPKQVNGTYMGVAAGPEGSVYLLFNYYINNIWTPYYMVLNGAGNTIVAPTSLSGLMKAGGGYFYIRCAKTDSDGNILISGQDYQGKGLVQKIDLDGNIVPDKEIKYMRIGESVCIDGDDNLHLVYGFGNNIGWAKFDRSGGIDNVSLTDLLTKYRKYNF